MKKFWNLMLAALVIIGATACTENYDGIEKAQNTEGFSFYAEVVNDGTRAYIANEDGDKTWNTVWELNDVLIVKVADAEYGASGSFEVTFKCTDVEKGKFTSDDPNAVRLQNQPVTITTNGTHHSLEGKEAFYINTTTTFDVENPIKLEALTSFFRFTFNGTGNVTLTLTEAAFRSEKGTAVNDITVSGTGDQFVAFWPGESLTATLTCYVGGVQCKSKELTFTAGKVYNLGEIVTPVASTTWGITGSFQGWDVKNPAKMYEVGDALVAYNLTKLNGGFKFTQNKDWNGAYGAVCTVKTNLLMAAGTDGVDIKTADASAYDVYFYPSSAVYCIVPAGNAAVKLSDNMLYLVPNANWRKDGARFAAYFFGNGEKWVSMADSDQNGIYEVTPPSGYPNVIFCRMNPSNTANNWDNKWNQTADLTCPSDGTNLYTVKEGTWGDSGEWSVK